MSYKIISASEQMEAHSMVYLIYGEPGIGKTSLAYTASNPLLEDFDNGAHRAVNRKNTIRIDSWEDAVEFHNSKDFQELAPDTLIFDTGGTLLDNFMANYVKALDKSYKQRGGELTLKGYGAMKSLFKQFVDDMKAKNIDLIFVCHTETMQEGDEIKRRPKMTGGSYDILIQVADMVGYMESANNKITLDFNPRDRQVGKNTAEFSKLTIPHHTEEKYSSYMADLINETKEKIKRVTEKQKEIIDALNDLRTKINSCANAKEVLMVKDEASSMDKVIQVQIQKNVNERIKELIDPIQSEGEINELLEVLTNDKSNLTEAKKALNSKAEALGFKYNKQLGQFEDAKIESNDTNISQ